MNQLHGRLLRCGFSRTGARGCYSQVYDIAWGGVGVFASVSADGSVRVFDLRDKEHSTIIYESPQPETPLLRLSWNKQDARYMATILMDSSK
eukprot:4932309-Pyramimonas_sp.AAC.1